MSLWWWLGVMLSGHDGSHDVPTLSVDCNSSGVWETIQKQVGVICTPTNVFAFL
jgi:hypothetical protein